MFNLSDSMRYWLYNKPTDMRKSFCTLSGIVNNNMNLDPCSGDVFIFLNKRRNRIKLLHWEPGGLVIYSKMLEKGTFGYPGDTDKEIDSLTIQWRDLVLLVEGIVENKDCRKARLEHLKQTV